MNFTRLVPNVYYQDIKDGLKIFVECLEFKIGHEELKSDDPFCVIEKDGLQMYLFQHGKMAKEHNPEFRLQTNVIDEVYQKVSSSHPGFLHPNLSKVTLRPWGAKEFALRDNQVCIIIQQW
ncbi:hypothetical protein J0A67_22020 [Algoriphagus aestuariicola]|uniref:VOC domain-containing protein n=1 Tax=Algoriphagus aestuariicola TaxID=1852016 RepID=A0ABS3BW92_9BACT|nr:hypothetical protein [Algoriphagus aestuariicola]MBN7803562.1 hypothetical protein [Algoriphagus aestuariicola]